MENILQIVSMINEKEDMIIMCHFDCLEALWQRISMAHTQPGPDKFNCAHMVLFSFTHSMNGIQAVGKK